MITVGLAQRVPQPLDGSLDGFAADAAATLAAHPGIGLLVYPELHLCGNEHLPEGESGSPPGALRRADRGRARGGAQRHRGAARDLDVPGQRRRAGSQRRALQPRSCSSTLRCAPAIARCSPGGPTSRIGPAPSSWSRARRAGRRRALHLLRRLVPRAHASDRLARRRPGAQHREDHHAGSRAGARARSGERDRQPGRGREPGTAEARSAGAAASWSGRRAS